MAATARDMITGDVRISYPSLFTARAMPGDANAVPKFSAVFLIPKSTDMKPYIAALNAAMMESWGKLMDRKAMKHPPIVNSEIDGYWRIRASAKRRPGVVFPDLTVVTEEQYVYPGMWVRAHLRTYTYDKPNRGVSFGLQNVQLVRDGERLDGGRRAEEVFAPVEGGFNFGEHVFNFGEHVDPPAQKPATKAPRSAAPAPAASDEDWLTGGDAAAEDDLPF